MSGPTHGGEESPPTVDDPFLAEDPAALDRERRRLEREAKRRGRENRRSLGDRVGGALDGAASRGREAIEQTRERARSPEPPAEGVEPPAFRRTPSPPTGSEAPDSAPGAASASAQQAAEWPASVPAPGEGARIAAEVAMPRRPPRQLLDTQDVEAAPPEPLGAGGGPQPVSDEAWSAAPPLEPPPPGGVRGAHARGPRRRPPGGGSAGVWLGRLLALGAIALLVVGAAVLLSKVDGGDPAPPPAGPKKLKTTSITIPEGYTADEMASVAKKAGLKGSYEDAAKKAAKKFDLAKAGAPKGASLEGFLFPATYEVVKGAPASDLVGKQLEAFGQNIAQVDTGYAKQKNLSIYDVVTIASMIEREVQVPKERPIVAAVIYNRLQREIPLEIDATVRYAIGNDFSKSLEPSDLQVDSPYNTYRYAGLPAGPIANPGLDSLQAAANPTDDPYLYYVVKPGTCGEHFFTDDYDEFLAASQKYDVAQAAAGGSPTEC